MTPLRKLTILILAILVFFVFFLVSKKIELAICFIVIAFLLSLKWYQLMIEELIVYKLFSHGKKMKYAEVIEFFGKKAIPALNRLKKKEIIKKLDDDILLKISSYKFSFTKWSP